VLGPTLSNPGAARNVGGAPCAQNPAQCCQYAPWLDLAAYWDGMGAPTGFSVHGRRTPKHFQSAGLTSVEAAGDLVRHIALARSGISLTPGTCSGPPQCPRVQQSQQNAPEVPRQANFLATAACSMEEGDVRRDSFWKGGDLRRPVRQRGMDYLRALLVTPYD